MKFPAGKFYKSCLKSDTVHALLHGTSIYHHLLPPQAQEMLHRVCIAFQRRVLHSVTVALQI